MKSYIKRNGKGAWKRKLKWKSKSETKWSVQRNDSKMVDTCFESSKKCFNERFSKIHTGPWKYSALIKQCFSAKHRFIFQNFNHFSVCSSSSSILLSVCKTKAMYCFAFLCIPGAQFFYRYCSTKCLIQHLLKSIARFIPMNLTWWDVG